MCQHWPPSAGIVSRHCVRSRHSSRRFWLTRYPVMRTVPERNCFEDSFDHVLARNLDDKREEWSRLQRGAHITTGWATTIFRDSVGSSESPALAVVGRSFACAPSETNPPESVNRWRGSMRFQPSTGHGERQPQTHFPIQIGLRPCVHGSPPRSGRLCIRSRNRTDVLASKPAERRRSAASWNKEQSDAARYSKDRTVIKHSSVTDVVPQQTSDNACDQSQ